MGCGSGGSSISWVKHELLGHHEINMRDRKLNQSPSEDHLKSDAAALFQEWI